MTAAATASPVRAAVGDRITVTVGLEAPGGSTVALVNPPSSPAFTRLSVAPWSYRRIPGGWRIERAETWAPFAPGPVAPLSYAYSIRPGPGNAAARPASGSMATSRISVPSVLPAGTAPPAAAPYRPPITKTFVSWQLAAALLLAAAVAGLFVFFLRRRRRDAAFAVRTADEVFDAELDLLEGSLAKSVPEETFYDWLAEITRWYLEQKLAVPATRFTSSEIVSRARERVSEESADDLHVVFSTCDGFRFARIEHRREQALSAIAAAREAAAAIREGESAAARESA